MQALNHPKAIHAFHADTDALEWADTIIMILPCGDSSHLELGYGVGAGKKTGIYMPEGVKRPELMYKLVDHISVNMGHLLPWLASLE